MSMNNTSKSNQLTEQGQLMIEVYIKDVTNNVIIGTKLIKRSELAKLMHEHKIVSSQNNKFIIGY